MNIFALSNEVTESAQWHVDKHVVKMPLETAQILCTARHSHGEEAPYRATHKHHPCCKWAADSVGNYVWLGKLGLALAKEYTYRYGKIHKCEEVIEDCLENIPSSISKEDQTTFVQAMPDECKMADPILGYRNYYVREKNHLASWKNRPTPPWWPDV